MKYLAGIKPTGELHLGHFVSSIKPLLDKKKEGHNIEILIADHHARNTLDDETIDEFKYSMEEVLEKYFEGYEIYNSEDYIDEGLYNMYFEMMNLCTLPLLQRCHAYKALEDSSTANMGLLTYPVMMAADIITSEADCILVGEDQRQHLEIAQLLRKRHITHYNSKHKEFTHEVTTTSLLGYDGEKMSKSKGNQLELTASDTRIKEYVLAIRTSSEVTPEGCKTLLNNARAIMPSSQYMMYEFMCKNSNSYRELKETLTWALIEYYNNYVRVNKDD